MNMTYSMFQINPEKQSFETKKYQYWIILSGNGEFSSKTETFFLSAHDVLEIPFDKSFKVKCSVPIQIGCIELNDFQSNNTYFQKKDHSDTELLRKTFFFAIEVQGLHLSEQDKTMYYVDHLMYEALVNSGMKTYRINSGIKAAIEDLNMHIFDADYDTKNAIEKSGYSQSYFHKLFHETTGVSPIEFIQIQRVEYAKTLLSQSDSPSIQEVAQQCAFSDAYYFSKIFKRHTGVSPSAYAKMRSGN